MEAHGVHPSELSAVSLFPSLGRVVSTSKQPHSLLHGVASSNDGTNHTQGAPAALNSTTATPTLAAQQHPHQYPFRDEAFTYTTAPARGVHITTSTSAVLRLSPEGPKGKEITTSPPCSWMRAPSSSPALSEVLSEVVTVHPCGEKIHELGVDSRIRVCQQRLSEKHVQNIELEAELEGVKGKLASAKTALAAKEGVVKDLEEGLRQLKELHEGKGAWYIKQKQGLDETIASLRDEASRLQGEKSAATAGLRLQLSEAQMTQKTLYLDITRKDALIDKLSSEIDSLKTQLAEKSSGNRALILSLKATEREQHNTTNTKTQHLEATIAEQKEKLASLNEIVNNFNEAQQSLRTKYKAVCGELEEIHAKEHNKRTCILEERDSLRNEVHRLEQHAQDLHRSSEQLHATHLLEAQEHDLLLHAHAAAAKTMEGQYEDLIAERDQLTLDIINAQQGHTALTNTAHHAEREADQRERSLQQQISSLEGDIALLKEERTQHDTDFKRVLSKKNSQICALEDELSAKLQLIPQHNLVGADAEKVHRRELSIRAALARALSDVLYLNTLATSSRVMRCNPESDEVIHSRAVSIPIEGLAVKIEALLAQFVLTASDMLRKEPTHLLEGSNVQDAECALQ